ncbi:anhydro-N-acetylmuramic acid kinase [Maritimibacter dapengensis]|uniref:Anhydro-N-acetylmuramic acid kinase n=1 Tax=Maritimibacter dapengensis TaxID=2836868 RepID=A0ABS6SZJ5_9RHOB|nr:anhydro-N-acetylmuramic acid kinase [Maritimibacter dapengensis]MBV7378409.1 anhydro-N-acetylmuramic acid kinase [Maritimibacter dapengensis]
MLEGRPVWALGAMSGTSLDGVDAAMVLTDGEVIHDFGETGYRAYSDNEAGILRAALGRWPGEPGVEEAARMVEAVHAELLGGIAGAELVGFHGQTLAHDPKTRGTHQAGDGHRLAEALGVPVAWDFRTADVALGGEGAPLAPFYHFALAKFIGAEAPLAFLNLGGVGNITWIDPAHALPEDEGALLAFDTGPANAPINDLMRARRHLDRDEDGALAAEGFVDEAIVEAFLADPYFLRVPPKSLDRDAFAGLSRAVEDLSDADAVASVTACAAASVAQGLNHCPALPVRLLVCGGGRKNAALMGGIAERTGVPTFPVEEVGLDGDMLEAQAFAYLAVRVARGLPTSCPATTGVAANVGGGTISEPA